MGGAVRDKLLGRPVKERDYLVVGATPERMLALTEDPGRYAPVPGAVEKSVVSAGTIFI